MDSLVGCTEKKFKKNFVFSFFPIDKRFDTCYNSLASEGDIPHKNKKLKFKIEGDQKTMKKNVMTYEAWARKIIDEYEFTTCGYVCEQDCEERYDYSPCGSCTSCIHFLSCNCDAAREAYENDMAREAYYNT